MAWYIRFLAQQVTTFAGAITRAVRLLGQRVDRLEALTVEAAEKSLAELNARHAGPDLSEWLDVVSTALAGVDGRLLHTECRDGTLVARLLADGLDAYGVEPNEVLAMAAARAGVDVRVDDAVGHLRALPDGALGGLVLSGIVDVAPLGIQLELARLAAAKLGPGGVFVVVSSAPDAWTRSLDPVTADLAPGRPLHPETWCQLLVARQFADPMVSRAAPASALELLPDASADAAVLNANLERLNRLLFAPSAYAVAAHKR
jgi:hypothetical protein